MPRDSDLPATALYTILENPWIDRIWTLQEAALSSNPIIICGNNHLRWRNLVYAITFIEHSVKANGLRISSRAWSAWQDLISLSALCEREAIGNHDQANTWDSSPSVPEDALARYRAFIDTIWRSWQRWYLLHSWLLSITLISLAAAFIIGMVMIPKLPGAIIALILGAFLCLCTCVLIDMCIPHADFGNTTGLKKRTDPLHQKTALAETIIQEIRSRNCSNPLDKSFGTFSILQRLGFPVSSPDYSLSQNEVHKDLLVRLLSAGQSLNLLLLNEARTDSHNTSWVPNWNTKPGATWILDDYIFSRTLQHSTSNHVLNARGCKQWSHDGGQMLQVRGVRIGAIKWKTPAFRVCSDPLQHDDHGILGFLRSLFNIETFVEQPEHWANVQSLFELSIMQKCHRTRQLFCLAC